VKIVVDLSGHAEDEVVIHQYPTALGLASQAGELVKTEGWQKGDLKEALANVFLKIDDILSQESVKGELTEMAGPADDTQ
jgi:hypothetical protein